MGKLKRSNVSCKGTLRRSRPSAAKARFSASPGNKWPRRLTRARSKEAKQKIHLASSIASCVPLNKAPPVADENSMDRKVLAERTINNFENLKRYIREAINEKFHALKLNLEPLFLSLDYSKELLSSFTEPSSRKPLKKGRSKENRDPSFNQQIILNNSSYSLISSNLSQKSSLIPLAQSSLLNVDLVVKKPMKSVKFTETLHTPVANKKYQVTPGPCRTPLIYRRPGIGEAAVSEAGSPLIVSENVSGPTLSVPTVDGRLIALVPPLDDSIALTEESIPRVAPPVRRQLAILQKYISQVLERE